MRFARCVALAAIMVLITVGSERSAQAQRVEPPDSAAYLLVIDHSGSMEQEMPSGMSRWEEMQQKAIEFIKIVPLESRIWLLVFAGEKPQPELVPFATAEDRRAVIERIRHGYGQPRGGTALFDTLGIAFEEAERLARDNPNRNISVLAYTDGKDEHSETWTPDQLAKRFEKIVGLNKNFWVFYTQIGDEGDDVRDVFPVRKETEAAEQISVGAFKIPLPITLAPPAVGLANPILRPRQPIELAFGGSNATWDLLAGTSVAFKFVPEPGSDVQVRALAIPFRKGVVRIDLEVTNPDDLKSDREYSGDLQIIYPDMPNHEVNAPSRVAVTFQKEDRLEIYDHRPADGAIFAAGSPIHFWVNTLQGAKILWDFGDGQSATGIEATHVYNTPGKRTVTLSAVSNPRVGPTTKKFSLEIIELGVSVDPFQSGLLAGMPCQFTCTGRGDIQRYEWLIDGQSFEGRPLDEPTQKGSQIGYTFQRPGNHVIRVVGHAEKAVVNSQERFLDVIARTSLEIVRPQVGEVLDYGVKHTFRAQASGPMSSLVWSLHARPADSPDAPEVKLAEIPRPIEQSDEGPFSEVEYTFAEQADAQQIRIEAIGILPPEVKLSPPTASATIRVQHARLKPRIDLGGKSSFPIDKPVPFRLECPQGFESIEWDFGDKTTESDTPNPLHPYKQHGTFVVRARVTGKGGQHVDLEETIHLVATPPKAIPRVLLGSDEVDHVVLGDTITLADESTGDLTRQTWFHNGEELPAGQASLPMETLGEHRLKLRVEGPPDAEGKIAVDEKELVFTVGQKPNWAAIAIAAAIALALFYIACRLLTRNGPRAWRIYYSNLQAPNEDLDPFVRVRQGWRWWGKYAEIPMKRFFGESDYWGVGTGSGELIRLEAFKSGTHWEGSLIFSGEGNDAVITSPVKEDGMRIDYRWKDNRATDDAYKTFHMRLVKRHDDAIGPLISLIAITCFLAGALWWISFQVLRGTF